MKTLTWFENRSLEASPCPTLLPEASFIYYKAILESTRAQASEELLKWNKSPSAEIFSVPLISPFPTFTSSLTPRVHRTTTACVVDVPLALLCLLEVVEQAIKRNWRGHSQRDPEFVEACIFHSLGIYGEQLRLHMTGVPTASISDRPEIPEVEEQSAMFLLFDKNTGGTIQDRLEHASMWAEEANSRFDFFPCAATTARSGQCDFCDAFQQSTRVALAFLAFHEYEHCHCQDHNVVDRASASAHRPATNTVSNSAVALFLHYMDQAHFGIGMGYRNDMASALVEVLADRRATRDLQNWLARSSECGVDRITQVAAGLSVAFGVALADAVPNAFAAYRLESLTNAGATLRYPSLPLRYALSLGYLCKHQRDGGELLTKSTRLWVDRLDTASAYSGLYDLSVIASVSLLASHVDRRVITAFASAVDAIEAITMEDLQSVRRAGREADAGCDRLRACQEAAASFGEAYQQECLKSIGT